MYYTIRQMAEMFDVTEHTLRFYTDKGLLPCERDGGNRRVFNEESVNWMQGIKCLKGCVRGTQSSESSARKPISVSRKPRPRRNTWTKRLRTMKPFWQGLLRMTPIRKIGRRRTGQSIESGLAIVQNNDKERRQVLK